MTVDEIVMVDCEAARDQGLHLVHGVFHVCGLEERKDNGLNTRKDVGLKLTSLLVLVKGFV